MKFDPLPYLKTYYSTVDSENAALLRFWAQLPIKDAEHASILEVGCGPTVFTAIPLINRCFSYTATDFLQANLDLVDQWIHKPSIIPFYWEHIIQWYLRDTLNPATVAEHAACLRNKLQLAVLDVHHPELSTASLQPYDVVVSSFCLAEASANKTEFKHYFKNVAALAKTQNTLGIVSAVRSHEYHVNGTRTRMANIEPCDIVDCFDVCGYQHIHVELIPISDFRGYAQIAAVWGQRT